MSIFRAGEVEQHEFGSNCTLVVDVKIWQWMAISGHVNMSHVKVAWRTLTVVSIAGVLALCTNAGNKLICSSFVRIVVCIFQFLMAQSSSFLWFLYMSLLIVFTPLGNLCISGYLHVPPMTGISLSYYTASIFMFLFKQEETPPLFI